MTFGNAVVMVRLHHWISSISYELAPVSFLYLWEAAKQNFPPSKKKGKSGDVTGISPRVFPSCGQNMWPQTVWGQSCWCVRPSQHYSFVRVFARRRPNQSVRRANISVPRWVAWSWDGKETHPWPGWQQKWVKRFIMPCDQHDTVFMAKLQIPPKNVRNVATHYMSTSKALEIMDEAKAWWNCERLKVFVHFHSSRNKEKNTCEKVDTV